MNYKHQKTKTLTIKNNGRSSDFVTPNFILGCEGGCQYCYVERWNRPSIYFNSNVDQILQSIKTHSESLSQKQPNQVDPKYWTYDIGCSTDVTLYWNKYPFDKILKYFRDNGIKSTFATKYVNKKMLREAQANEQNRIRFSLSHERVRMGLEPKTTSIPLRIDAVNYAVEHGWDTHLNFSPIVYFSGWLDLYRELFIDLDRNVINKKNVKCECIFLTHHKGLHERNILDPQKAKFESVLWNESIQQNKVSNYGGENVRYKYILKNEMIEEFKFLHQELIPWCEIRYIF